MLTSKVLTECRPSKKVFPALYRQKNHLTIVLFSKESDGFIQGTILNGTTCGVDHKNYCLGDLLTISRSTFDAYYEPYYGKVEIGNE